MVLDYEGRNMVGLLLGIYDVVDLNCIYIFDWRFLGVLFFAFLFGWDRNYGYFFGTGSS